MALVRRLTDAGRAAFRGWIEADAPGAAPRDLLWADDVSEALAAVAIVDDGAFGSRLECGWHLSERLKGLPLATLRFDEGVWDWLSLFYIDQLQPIVNTSGKYKGRHKETVKYCLQLSNRKWSRHFIRMNWTAVREHGDAARVMLSGPMNVNPDIVEQLSGQQEMFGSKGVIAAADALYSSGKVGTLKKGHATATAPGAVQRLRTVMRQFELTWDLEMLSAGQVLELLPREFERWKPAGPGARVGSVAEGHAMPAPARARQGLPPHHGTSTP